MSDSSFQCIILITGMHRNLQRSIYVYNLTRMTITIMQSSKYFAQDIADFLGSYFKL